MQQIAAIKFIDQDSGDEAWVMVRTFGEITALGLSLISNGDIEVTMKPAELDRLIEALNNARAVVTRTQI